MIRAGMCGFKQVLNKIFNEVHNSQGNLHNMGIHYDIFVGILIVSRYLADCDNPGQCTQLVNFFLRRQNYETKKFSKYFDTVKL